MFYCFLGSKNGVRNFHPSGASAFARPSSCAPVPRATAGPRRCRAWRQCRSRQKCRSSSRSVRRPGRSHPIATAAGGPERLLCRAGPLPTKLLRKLLEMTVLHLTPSLGFISFQKLRSRPSPPVASFQLLLPGCSRHTVQPDISRTADRSRKIARRFFMGRILTAVVGRQLQSSPGSSVFGRCRVLFAISTPTLFRFLTPFIRPTPATKGRRPTTDDQRLITCLCSPVDHGRAGANNEETCHPHATGEHFRASTATLSA